MNEYINFYKLIQRFKGKPSLGPLNSVLFVFDLLFTDQSIFVIIGG